MIFQGRRCRTVMNVYLKGKEDFNEDAPNVFNVLSAIDQKQNLEII